MLPEENQVIKRMGRASVGRPPYTGHLQWYILWVMIRYHEDEKKLIVQSRGIVEMRALCPPCWWLAIGFSGLSLGLLFLMPGAVEGVWSVIIGIIAGLFGAALFVVHHDLKRRKRDGLLIVDKEQDRIFVCGIGGERSWPRESVKAVLVAPIRDVRKMVEFRDWIDAPVRFHGVAPCLWVDGGPFPLPPDFWWAEPNRHEADRLRAVLDRVFHDVYPAVSKGPRLAMTDTRKEAVEKMLTAPV